MQARLNSKITKSITSHLVSDIQPSYLRKKTLLTENMLNMLHEFLDEKLPELKENPSRTQNDSFGRILPDGSISKYSLDYPEMGPDIFYKALFKHKTRILHYNIKPFNTYHYDVPIQGYAELKKQFAQTHLPNWPFI